MVTGRKLRLRKPGAVWEVAPATCPVWSIHPSPHLPTPSVADLRLCPCHHVQGHPPIAEAAGIGIEGRCALEEPLIPDKRFSEKG